MSISTKPGAFQGEIGFGSIVSKGTGVGIPRYRVASEPLTNGQRYISRPTTDPNNKQDGNFYYDMTGDKMDDYMNIGQLPDWGQEGWVFTQEWDCKRVRIADVDGDDNCDIIHLAKNGVVEHWYKTHYENGQWRFEEEFGEIRGLEIALILLTDLGVPPTADQ
ncbi:hypothetical protein BJX66DRAFT_345896 [Aspergillus keveii]|uniref:Uncharacterized protein n=1 Tax=Aspergillus keveii TaxID=714993 RepID=A0ABR4FGK2_9EURO